jgi:hypothetical protein
LSSALMSSFRSRPVASSLSCWRRARCFSMRVSSSRISSFCSAMDRSISGNPRTCARARCSLCFSPSVAPGTSLKDSVGPGALVPVVPGAGSVVIPADDWMPARTRASTRESSERASRVSGEKVGGRASGCGPDADADAGADDGDMVCRFYDTTRFLFDRSRAGPEKGEEERENRTRSMWMRCSTRI